MIERELRNRIRDSEPVSLLHIDLDDFKAFNDVYGFHRGDVAISVTAELLARELEAVSGRHFLGHIGGDDFLAIVQADVAEALTERLGTEFQRQIVALYEDDDVRRGFICAADRAGVHQTFPLMTITIAAAFVEPNDERHYAQLLDALSAAKREAKSRKRARRISPRHVLAS
jgi:diguanylate cyclase (GGDEF)-like protein